MDAVRIATLARGVNGDGIVLRVHVEGRQILQHSTDAHVDDRAALDFDTALISAVVDDTFARIISRGIDTEAADIDLGAVHEDDAVRVDQGHVARRIELAGDFRHITAAHGVDEQVGPAVLFDIDRGILADVECIPADERLALAFCLLDGHDGFCGTGGCITGHRGIL